MIVEQDNIKNDSVNYEGCVLIDYALDQMAQSNPWIVTMREYYFDMFVFHPTNIGLEIIHPDFTFNLHFSSWAGRPRPLFYIDQVVILC